MKLLSFPYANRKLHFIFGPYRNRVPGTYGVRLTENQQLDLPCDLHFPIPDFGVPSARAFEDLLIKLIAVAAEGKVVYVGCFGGIGRTGMVVAGLARALVITDRPVAWARDNYLPHTIETSRQETLIAQFDVNRVREAMFQGARLERIGEPTQEKTGLQLAALWSKVQGLFGKQGGGAGEHSRKS